MKKPKLPKFGNKEKNASEANVNADFTTANYDISPNFASAAFAAADLAYEDNSDGFDVNVRNAETGIRLIDQKNENPWLLREMPHEIATAISLMSVFALLLAASGNAMTIPFLLVGVIVYTVLTFLEEKLDNRIRLYVAAGIFVALVAVGIIMRKYLWGGIGLIMNSVYDASEATQAYIYNRFGTGATADEHFTMCIRTAAVFLSTALGMLAALPPAAIRRALGIAAAIYSMILFAYYGIIPATVCIAIIIAALVLVLARGGLLSVLPVLLASLAIFGIIMLISPGENYSISRADENFRDRFALRSAYLESDTYQDFQDDMENQFEDEDPFSEEDNEQIFSEYKWLLPLIIFLLILAGLGVVAFLLYQRYKKRRAANREGIDSDDPRTAIVAMFPYAIRWLKAADLDVAGKNFASLVDPLRKDISEQYAKYYSSMYVLWREAAYSDHEMQEEKKYAMNEFMEETANMVKRDLDWKGKIITALKYAL